MAPKLAAPQSTLNVSLEEHLLQALRPLPPLLPEPLATDLSRVLADTSPPPTPDGSFAGHTPSNNPLIPYALLTAISQWSRTVAAQRVLASHKPPLRAQDYSMLALLAGTRTSPERRFPRLPNPALDDPQSTRSRELSDRRAVTALVNALLSIAGSGLATWWAADHLAWRDQWKVLLALLVAVVVASSEAILYLIWADRRSKSSRSRPLRFRRSAPSAATADTCQNDKKAEKDIIDTPSQSEDHLTSCKAYEVAVVSATTTALTASAEGNLRDRVTFNIHDVDHTAEHNQ